jgi:peroxiredoxin
MMLPLGAKAPSFDLVDPSGRRFSLESLDGAPALLVAFICSHCPFAKHVRAGFASLATKYQKSGVAVVAIASNDVGPSSAADPRRTR